MQLLSAVDQIEKPKKDKDKKKKKLKNRSKSVSPSISSSSSRSDEIGNDSETESIKELDKKIYHHFEKF